MTYIFTGSEGIIGRVSLKRGDTIELSDEDYANAVDGGASLAKVCQTCNGDGWLMKDEGQPCPACTTSESLGGTGLKPVITRYCNVQFPTTRDSAEE